MSDVGVRRVDAVVLAGPPAAGKSTVGAQLAGHLGAALLDLDTATAPLVAVVANLVGSSDLDDSRLAEATRVARYETLAALAEDNLRAGTPVVLVAPFTAERRNAAQWARLAARLRDSGGAPLLVWLRLDAVEVARRLRARGAERDLAKAADPGSAASGLDLAAPEAPHVAVDAAQPVPDVVSAVLAAVAAAG